jgi:hypothetical protein
VATRDLRRRLPAASAGRTGSLNDRCSRAAAMGRDGWPGERVAMMLSDGSDARSRPDSNPPVPLYKNADWENAFGGWKDLSSREGKISWASSFPCRVTSSPTLDAVVSHWNMRSGTRHKRREAV